MWNKKWINEDLYPATTKELLNYFLNTIEYDDRLKYYMNKPIEEVDEFNSFVIKIPNIKQVRKYSLLFLIKYLFKKEEFKTFFIIQDAFRFNRITGFMSYIEEDDMLKNLFFVAFKNISSDFLNKELDYITEKQLIKHYLYLLLIEKLQNQSKVVIEINRNDFRTYSHCMDTVRSNYELVYSIHYNEDSDHWIFSFAENYSKLNAKLRYNKNNSCKNNIAKENHKKLIQLLEQIRRKE